MRLVKLELRDAPFWFLSDSTTNIVFIALNFSSPLSGLIDIDSLEDNFVDVINSSASRLEISIVDSQNRRLRSLNEVIFLDEEHAVNTEDDPSLDVSDFPEIISVTVKNDDDEEVEEEEEICCVLTPEIQENVKILLEKNGNTIKKMIKNLSKTKENLFFLENCVKTEKKCQNRQGIISALQTVITENK
jgi:hypothetical protein